MTLDEAQANIQDSASSVRMFIAKLRVVLEKRGLNTAGIRLNVLSNHIRGDAAGVPSEGTPRPGGLNGNASALGTRRFNGVSAQEYGLSLNLMV